MHAVVAFERAAAASKVNGTTWVRYTSEAGAISLFVEAPSGKTVSMVIGSKLTWDDALPMVQNVVLK